MFADTFFSFDARLCACRIFIGYNPEKYVFSVSTYFCMAS